MSIGNDDRVMVTIACPGAKIGEAPGQDVGSYTIDIAPIEGILVGKLVINTVRRRIPLE